MVSQGPRPKEKKKQKKNRKCSFESRPNLRLTSWPRTPTDKEDCCGYGCETVCFLRDQRHLQELGKETKHKEGFSK